MCRVGTFVINCNGKINIMNDKPLYDEFVSHIQSQKFVLGLIIAGSHAKGLQNKDSDLDLYIVVEENLDNTIVDQLKDDITNTKYSNLHIDVTNNAIQTLNDFSTYANVGSKYEWDRYNLVHTKTVFDKTNGKLQELLTAKAKLHDHEAKTVINNYLGAYINLSYRSLKSAENNMINESILDAGESVEYMLSCLFALESRVKPFNKYLRWDLSNQKLNYENQLNIDLYELIITYAKAEPSAHKQIFQMIKDKATMSGFNSAYSAWGEKLSLFDN